MFKSQPQTKMFDEKYYTNHVVGYLKVDVVTVGLIIDALKGSDSSNKLYWFGVNYEGKIITKKDTVDAYMPSDYILDCAKLPAAADALKDFGERTGLTITQPELISMISRLKDGTTEYMNQTLGTVSPAPSDSNATIFNLLTTPDKIAFFLVDLTTKRLYTCTKDGIVKWNVSISVEPPASWNDVWSYVPFCTVKNLSAPKNEKIDFYPRTKTKLTGDKFNFDAASPDYKKIPPPFNLAIYSSLRRKTFQEVLADVQKKIGDVASTEVPNASETNNRQLAFVKDLKEIGCNGEPENYILDENKCNKIDALMEKLTPLAKGGRRSKRNKHRRNKRTVSHRGRGHKRSRRVDGGSRKCGKKCRRKHTRK